MARWVNVLLWAVLCCLCGRAQAHPVDLSNAVEHVWQRQSTGEEVGGALLAVTDDAVRIERLDGSVVTWPKSDLIPADRDLVTARRAAVVARNLTCAPDASSAQATAPVSPAASPAATDFLLLGFRHILPEGLDHVLFVVGLFLLCRGMKSVMLQIAAFTLSHTITLSLGAFGLVNISAAVIEPMIALSIAFVAIENLWFRRPTPWRTAAAFCFGLIHGLGVASDFRELATAPGWILPRLSLFTVGVEAGHLTVLLGAWILLGRARDRSWYVPRVAVPISGCIAAIALYWAGQRVSFSFDSEAMAAQPAAATTRGSAPAQAAPFLAFAPAVKATWDDRWLYVESNGLPAHTTMVGIRSWQQQVPLPQSYFGRNAWQIPLHPALADKPISAKTALFRGAIAIAANGVPIFNALNNRGEDTLKAGELDDFGGHSGRADDYHYHTAPLFLQKILGPDKPIAYALDGYPIYGLFDDEHPCPCGGTHALDEFNGHFGKDGTYHYHATLAFPYINGGMRGVVTVRGDQIDPQPRTRPVRDFLQPLRGARVSGFTTLSPTSWTLEYTLGGKVCSVHFEQATSTTITFVFTDASGARTTHTYSR
jgi:hypothetical protein